MFNLNPTTTKNKTLTIISSIIYIVTTAFLFYITLDVVMPAFTGEENAGIGLAFAILALIPFWLGAAVAFLISTILSIVSAISVKKGMQSKIVFIVDIILAILPIITLAISIFLYVFAAEMVNVVIGG